MSNITHEDENQIIFEDEKNREFVVFYQNTCNQFILTMSDGTDIKSIVLSENDFNSMIRWKENVRSS